MINPSLFVLLKQQQQQLKLKNQVGVDPRLVSHCPAVNPFFAANS